jgi:hypothetical protein
MKIRTLLRIAALALVLPGLVAAAASPGPCGHCDRGVPCPRAEMSHNAPSQHACCGDETATAPSAPSLASSGCDCGREAPLAVTADQVASPELVAAARTDHGEAASRGSGRVTARCLDRPPAPPPSHPTYLLDCAFLI